MTEGTDAIDQQGTDTTDQQGTDATDQQGTDTADQAEGKVGLVSQDQLDAAGHPLPPGVDLPTVDQLTLEDDDVQQSRLVNWDEIQPIYVDNPVNASAVQADVWTLEVDNQDVTLTYSNGAQANITLGSIDWDSAIGADHYRKSGNIVYPTDAAGTVLLNTVTAPHLVAMRTYVHDEVRKVSQDRLNMAELVARFAENIADGGHMGEHLK